MNKSPPKVSARQAQIEFLRARAAYERQALVVHTYGLGNAASPKRWLVQLLSPSGQAGARGGQHAANLLGQGLSLAAQYPYLFASVSSLAMGKRLRWVKWLGIGLSIWQISTRTVQESKNTQA